MMSLKIGKYDELFVKNVKRRIEHNGTMVKTSLNIIVILFPYESSFLGRSEKSCGHFILVLVLFLVACYATL